MRFRLLAKLLSAFLAVSIILGLAGLIILNSLQTVKREYQETAMRHQQANAMTSDAKGEVYRQVSAIRGYLLTEDPAKIQEYDEADRNLTMVVAGLVQLQPDQADQERATQLLALSTEWDSPIRSIKSLVEEGKTLEANVLVGEAEATYALPMIVLADELSQSFATRAIESEVAANDLAAQAEIVGYGALSAGLLLSLILGFLLARGITRPVQQVAAVAVRMAEGDLRLEPLPTKGRDEIADLARSINQMIQALQLLVGGVKLATESVSGSAAGLVEVAVQASQASDQAATAVSAVASGANRQATMSGDVSQTMRQLQSTVAQLSEGAVQTSAEVQQAVESLVRMIGEIDTMSDHASEVATASIQAVSVAKHGAETVARTAEGMERIRQAFAGTASSIQELEELSSRIGEINSAISTIAVQTNLLALNAAIEAARAGDAGRGFAVVADEVRKLAERSAASANEIADLVARVQEGTARAASTMGAGTREVKEGSALASSAGGALQEIVLVVEKTVQDVQGIAGRATSVQSIAKGVSQAFDAISAVAAENGAAAEEMAASAEQVLSSVGVIAEVSQENAAVAQEVSASAEELTASAGQVASSASQLQAIAAGLQTQVAQFKL